MFAKKKKIKSIARRALAIILSAATILSGIAISPKEAEAAASDPVTIAYVDLGFHMSDTEGGWNTNAADNKYWAQWITDIYPVVDKFTSYNNTTVYAIDTPLSRISNDYGKEGLGWNDYGSIMGNYTATYDYIAEKGINRVEHCPIAGSDLVPLFYRKGYRFVGWDVYHHKDGDSFNNAVYVGGVSHPKGAKYDYATNTGCFQFNTEDYDGGNMYLLKAVWEKVTSRQPTASGAYVAGTVFSEGGAREVEYIDVLDPYYAVRFYSPDAKFLTVGNRDSVTGLTSNLPYRSSEKYSFIKTYNALHPYGRTVSSLASNSIHTFSAMNVDGQWVNYTPSESNKITINMNPNGGSAKFCGSSRSDTTTAYRMKDAGTKVRLFPAAKTNYTFAGYSCSDGTTIPASSISSSGYTVSPTKSVTYTAQYTPNVVSSCSSYSGTYDGKPHTITTSFTPSSATVTYSTDGTNYSSTKPTRTDAGTTTVYYKAMADGYVTATGSQTITVTPATMSVSASGFDGPYDEAAHTISLNNVPSGSTITYSTDGTNYSSTKPTRTNAGTTTVYYKVANKNYNTASGSAKIVISKNDGMTVSSTNSTVPYDGKQHSIESPVVTVPSSGCKITYSSTENGTFTEEKPTYSDVGSYTVYWKAEDTNGNYSTKTGSCDLTIEPAYEYDAKTKSLVIYNTSDAGLALVYEKASAATSLTVADKANAGEIDFDRFEDLKSISVSAKGSAYSAKDGILYTADGTELVYCPLAYTEESVTLPYSVSKIRENVFADRAIDMITIKNPDCEIGEGAIQSPTKVTAFKDSAVIDYCKNEKINFEYIGEIGDSFFKNETTMTSFTVPDNITVIGKNAFNGCSALSTINLGQVESIGAGAFKSSGLNEVTIPNTVTTVGSEAFYYARSLATVAFAEESQLKSIGKDAFTGCSLSEITIPDSVDEIGAGAFANTNLGTIDFAGMTTDMTWDDNDIVLPKDAKISCFHDSAAYRLAKTHDYAILLKVGYDEDGVTSYEADEDAIVLIEGVSVGPNLVKIGNDAFNGAENLESVVFDKNSTLESIGKNAFKGTNIVDIDLPQATNTIGESAFAKIPSLKSISLGGVTDIPGQAFKGDSSLSTVTDSTKITTIGAEAFAGTDVGDESGVFYTGDDLKTLGTNAFADSSLKTLVIENPNAVFPNEKGLIPDTAVIRGYTPSTADLYSQKFYNKSCESLGKPAYTITFDTTGGIGGTESVYAVNGKPLPKIETPTMEDYKFKGYSTSTGGGGTQYFDAAGTPQVDWAGTSNITLYAAWEHETFTFEYCANGGEGTMESDVVNTKSDFTLSKNEFTRDGYEFLGWALAPDSKTAKYTDRETVRSATKADETVTLYAVWKPTFYTVKYESNGGTGSMNPQTFKVEKKGNLRENTFTRDGYTFLGWSEDSESDVATWYDKEPVSHLGEAGSTVTLYAVWAKSAVKQYTITFDANGGTADEKTAPAYEGHETRIPDIGAKRDGFVFAGWSMVKASGQVDYKTGDMISADKDITLYAVWETEGDTEYTIRISTQKADGDYVVTERQMKAIVGDVVTLTENIDFVVDAGYFVDETSSTLSQTIEEGTIFNIVLNREKVSVRFDLNADEATMNDIPTIKGLWGQRVVISSSMPERAGYTFGGWSLIRDEATPITEVTLPVGGVTVYAIWNPESEPSSSTAPDATVPGTTAGPETDTDNNPVTTPDPNLETTTGGGSTDGGSTDSSSSYSLQNTNTTQETTVSSVTVVNKTPKTDSAATLTVNKVAYKLSGKTATVTKCSSRATGITIRNTVKIGNKTVKVTKISKNAFKGCNKLKKVTIQAKSLKSIGKNAFKGIAKKAVIKVPKAKKKAYKKLLKKAEIAKTIRVK